MTTGEIPLFPLHTVLYPGSSLRLRIFEARYLDMVGACLKNEIDFGVVGIRSGEEVGAAETYSVGTTARIVDWDRDGDGILGLAVIGRQRFDIESRACAPNGLYHARVRLRPLEARVPVSPEQDWARSVVGTAARAPREGEVLQGSFDDASWLSWRVADILPLSLSEKQLVLETDDVGERLEWLRPKAEAHLAAQAG